MSGAGRLVNEKRMTRQGVIITAHLYVHHEGYHGEFWVIQSYRHTTERAWYEVHPITHTGAKLYIKRLWEAMQ